MQVQSPVDGQRAGEKLAAAAIVTVIRQYLQKNDGLSRVRPFRLDAHAGTHD